MTELLVAEEWAEPDSLGSYLEDVLPDGYFVLASPTVHGRALDAVVVGPQGLFVLYTRQWEGTVHPMRFGPWRGQLASGREVRYPSPAEEFHRAEWALRAFLRDEFPSLRPMIFHVLVLMSPDVKLAASEVTRPRPMTVSTVMEEITSTEAPPDRAELDDDVREELALALRDRRLTASQRTSEPFTFRSGGLFGMGKRVWTIRAAIRHMSSHPQAGIYHLRNGTLAQWLSDQGAEHVAELAREVMHRGEADARVALESFLVSTGLVHPPRLSVRPREIDLGFILSGEASARRLRVGKGWGRGYLFGTLQASDPWLDVEPRMLTGGSLESVVSVRARTDALLISPTAYRAEITIESNASDEPMVIPVRFRIVGMPSSLNRRVLRPLAGFVSAGVLGAGAGWSFGHWGVRASGWLSGLTSRSMSPAYVWAVLVGLTWALLGGIRGLRQRLAWPISFALRRWLVRTLAWAAALPLMALAGLWCWDAVHPQSAIDGHTYVAIPLCALACAILPAVLEEIWAARSAEQLLAEAPQGSILRPELAAAIGIALALLAGVGAPALGLIRQQYDLDSRAASVQQWVGSRSVQLERGINGFVDRLYLRYYDRRAPSRPTPTLSPPTPSPAPEAERH